MRTQVPCRKSARMSTPDLLQDAGPHLTRQLVPSRYPNGGGRGRLCCGAGKVRRLANLALHDYQSKVGSVKVMGG